MYISPFAIGPRVVEYAAKLGVIATAVNRVRNNVRQAAAIAKVVLPADADSDVSAAA